jgi:hypothetical protein
MLPAIESLNELGLFTIEFSMHTPSRAADAHDSARS